jgi:glutathione peroxidase
MTARQRLLKFAYPFWMLFAKLKKRHATVVRNENKTLPATSLYTLTVSMNYGENLLLEKFRGKKILFVNTASDCGYTDQYESLQKLYERFAGRLEIIAFPSNDFKQQEKENDAEIEKFCRLNFNTKFPLASKSIVKKQPGQNEIYQWLTQKEKNGWNDQAPEWNFAKYIVNGEGVLTHYFGPSVSPLDPEVLSALNNN